MASITNKFLSAEILGTLVLTAFAIGTTWAALASDVQATDEKVKSLTSHQGAIAKDVMEIKTDLAVVRAEQSHIKATIHDIKEQNKELAKIRDLLERMQ